MHFNRHRQWRAIIMVAIPAIQVQRSTGRNQFDPFEALRPASGLAIDTEFGIDIRHAALDGHYLGSIDCRKRETRLTMVGRKVAAVLHIVECHDRIAARVQRRKQIAAAVAGEAELLIGRAGTRGQDCDTAAKQTNETSSHPRLSPWAISASGGSQALLSSAFAGHELLDFVGVLFREIEIGSA
ncbi:MAG TPA: hypothetical protein VN612_06770, partial [Acidobacteriaceae bacterium]|nr:hypothetical protein [Acidobacteriaceae bacterium]